MFLIRIEAVGAVGKFAGRTEEHALRRAARGLLLPSGWDVPAAAAMTGAAFCCHLLRLVETSPAA